MKSRFRPNRLDIFALAAVILTTALFLRSALNAAEAYTGLRSMSVWEKSLGCLGWLLATFGPITVSLWLWRWSKRLRNAWMLHVLMFPLAYLLVRLGGSLMLSVIDAPDFDDTIGGPILQAGSLFVLAVIGYYSAVLFTFFQGFSKPPSSS